MSIRLIVHHVLLVIFATMAYQQFARRERIVRIQVPTDQLSAHLEAFAKEVDITSPAQLVVSVTTVVQFSVQLVHTVQQMELLSQQTVQLEIIALVAIILKNAILGVFRLEMLSIVPRVILAIIATELDLLNRFECSTSYGP